MTFQKVQSLSSLFLELPQLYSQLVYRDRHSSLQDLNMNGEGLFSRDVLLAESSLSD